MHQHILLFTANSWQSTEYFDFFYYSSKIMIIRHRSGDYKRVGGLILTFQSDWQQSGCHGDIMKQQTACENLTLLLIFMFRLQLKDHTLLRGPRKILSHVGSWDRLKTPLASFSFAAAECEFGDARFPCGSSGVGHCGLKWPWLLWKPSMTHAFLCMCIQGCVCVCVCVHALERLLSLMIMRQTETGSQVSSQCHLKHIASARAYYLCVYVCVCVCVCICGR